MTLGNRWTFRTLPLELANTSRWRKVDVDALESVEQERFTRFKAAIEAYIETGQLRAISKETGIAADEIVRQLNRCVAVADDGNLVGWTALIRGRRLKEYTRSSDLPAGPADTSSEFTGAFAAFLHNFPEIKRTIDDLILKRKGHIHEARISIKKLHETFIGLCEEAGITKDQYPFNARSRGRRSLDRYVQKIIDCHPEEGAEARHGKEARSRLNVGKGYSSSSISFAPYDLVGLDPHKLHCFGTVRIKGPAGYQRIPIERLWIVPILESEFRAVLGYSVGIRTECSAATIENAIISAMTQWRPRALKVPTMSYKSGAGLPSGLFPNLVGRGWVTMMVDNAAVHYSKAIAERARRRLGCFLNYGPVGHWEHRAALERLMKTLELYGFQRLPSSTGSSPEDPARGNPVKSAVAVGIDWEELLDLIDVVLADYNATPNEALGNRSPLSVISDFLHEEPTTFLPRRLPPPTAEQPELGITVETRYIRGNRSQGRRPYIEIDRVHYTNPVLAGAMALIGKKLRVHIRESNMCTVNAYHENGEELGILFAQGAWGRIPHTREMRKQVNALRDAGELAIGPDEDPIHQLLQFYASKAHKQAEKQPLKVSKSATKLANAAAVSGHSIPEVSATKPLSGQTIETSEKTIPSRLIKQPVWKTIIS